PPGFRFEQDLRRGDKSDDVKYLQILLNSDPDTRLADSGPGSPGKETVNFGDRTESAVIRFQEKYADEILKPIGYRKGTGFLGPRTREVLNRILESKSLSSLEPHGNAVPILPVVEPEDVLRALNTLNTATAILPTKAAGKFALGKITGLLKETAIALARKDLPKVKQRLDEAVEWARKPFKQAPKLTSTQQAAIAPYVARYGDRVLEYAQKYGDHGVRLLERAGKQIGVRAERFINEKEWVFHFNKHKVDTGLPWLGREFTSKEEYLAEAKSVITNPNSKKVLYYHQSNLNDPTLGYLLEREGKVFLVAVNDAGNIKTFHYLKEGWGYVQEGPVWNKLFKVDPF
ncbi:MAG: hypothetical protein HYW38_01200, partial [Candidatus Colwellbacteria bacterium]|nr:hypothetical protein [Candidatus Colwellbacteria bacterium]